MDPRLPSWVPHRPPALLLEGVVQADARGGTALARVDPGAWYADADGAMPGWVGLELMAQAVAACRGRSLADAGAPPRGGYLVGVRHYQCRVPAFPPGAALEVHARLELEDPGGLRAFRCEILMAGTPLAAAALTLLEHP